MGEAEQEKKAAVTPTEALSERKHRRVPMTKEALEARRAYLAQIREEISMEAEEETLQGARLAVRTLKSLAKNGRDERAKYSAAAKILDIVIPKSTGPLVNLSFGNNFVSHLGLPPPPERQSALPGPIRQSFLPEPTVMPKEILPEPELVVTKIAPEADKRAAFSRQAIDVTTLSSEPNTPKIGINEVKAPPAWPSRQPAREVAPIPPVTKIPEGS